MKPTRFETNFTRMVDEDILRCEGFLAGNRDEKSGEELHIELAAKYPSYIAHFGEHLRKFNPGCGFVMMEYFDRDSLVHDLIVMKSRLIAFKNHGYRNSSLAAIDGGKSVKPSAQGPDGAASFAKARQMIQEMTGLSEATTLDVLEKVDAIEEAARSTESKKAKWLKVGPILTWLAGESADVGSAVLPLLLKVGG